jgi:hypothetical protein
VRGGASDGRTVLSCCLLFEFQVLSVRHFCWEMVPAGVNELLDKMKKSQNKKTTMSHVHKTVVSLFRSVIFLP